MSTEEDKEKFFDAMLEAYQKKFEELSEQGIPLWEIEQRMHQFTQQFEDEQNKKDSENK